MAQYDHTNGGVGAPVGLTVFKTAGGSLGAAPGGFDSHTPLPAFCSENWDFHRLLGKKAFFIAYSEKVQGGGCHLRLFQKILPALPRKNPALPRKKSGDRCDIFSCIE